MEEKKHSYIASAAFGLEGVAAGELKRMGIPAKAEQGGARFEGTLSQAFEANLRLRSADRVLLLLREGQVHSFEDLYQLVLSLPWETYLPKDAAFPVSGRCVRSRLMSVRDCQSVAKKAICDRLGAFYKVTRLSETGAVYPLGIAIHRDLARVTLDMSGEALNRRGYRTFNGEAPLRETLAAALVDISPWRVGMPLYDPCCGTGTLLIEAAMKASGHAPGLNRSFACERFAFFPKEEAARLRANVRNAYDPEASFDIAGSDINAEALSLCQRHVAQAGYQGRIRTENRDLRTLCLSRPQGVFLANPPYGERLSDREACRELYREMGVLLRRHPGWRMGVIASDPGFERAFGRRADKKRRLYNGRLECEFFMYG